MPFIAAVLTSSVCSMVPLPSGLTLITDALLIHPEPSAATAAITTNRKPVIRPPWWDVLGDERRVAAHHTYTGLTWKRELCGGEHWLLVRHPESGRRLPAS